MPDFLTFKKMEPLPEKTVEEKCKEEFARMSPDKLKKFRDHYYKYRMRDNDSEIEISEDSNNNNPPFKDSKRFTIEILRWIFFLPIAIMASILSSGFFNYVIHFGIGWILGLFGKLKFVTDIISATIWFSAGFIAPLMWMQIGLKVAPKPNNYAKWILLIPCFLAMTGSAIGAVYFGDSIAHSMVPTASMNPKIGHIILSVTAFVTSILMIFGVLKIEEES